MTPRDSTESRPAVAPTEASFDAVVFDMDGVVTRTAHLHAAAWKELFDEFLRVRAERDGESFRPFDIERDYRAYVDGKPREEGVRSFLEARGIALPEGDAEPDAGGAETVRSLAKRKDAFFERRLNSQGVELFESTLSLVEALRSAGIKIAVVTSSRHGRDIIEKAGIEHLFDVRIDGNDIARRGLKGKPHPDAFFEAVAMLGTTPLRSIVVEDAVSGIAAGRAGGFGLVVGVDRGGNRTALTRQGADVVVADLGEIDVAGLDAHMAAAQERISWRVEQEGFDPARERGVESLFTIGNGYLGVRGALDTPLPVSQGDLFIAGVYDRKQTSRPYSEHEFMDPGSDHLYREIVSFPFPFQLCLVLDGTPLSLAGRWRIHRRVLDMRAGVLRSETVYEVGEDLLATVTSRRWASLEELHLLYQEVSICLENHSATLDLDFSTDDPELEVHHPHLVAQAPRMVDGIELRSFMTRYSRIATCIAQKATLVGAHDDRIRWTVAATIGEPLTFRRYVAIYTTRDVEDPQSAAIEALKGLGWERFNTAAQSHERAWERIWRRGDVRVRGRPAAEQALRFHAYHLSSAADRDPRISVGARALSGRAYEGHIFWDVEVFMLPFYLHTQPDVARCLLSYRHATLDGARRRAAELGQRGACYAWESTVTGEDVTPRVIVLRTTRKEIPIFTGIQQIHVTADVAFGLWRYWEATGDDEFLRGPGAEIMAETARFWTSRSVFEGDAYHIRGVVGPDEYHHGVNDNAYTNWMARFNLRKARQVLQWLQEKDPQRWGALSESIGLDQAEMDEWRAVAEKLYFPTPRGDGVIEQFEGFFDLEEYPLTPAERFKAPIDRLFDWDEINRLQLLKQADVLMLPFLFPERFDRRMLAANYRYYEPRTDHGSSLSPGVHAALAARLGLEEEAEHYWRRSLMFDLSDVMGNSTLGVHPACMGATWQALVFHFLGVRFTHSGPVVDEEASKRLPRRWRSVAMKLCWRGRQYDVGVIR